MNILGSEWSLEVKSYNDDPSFKELDSSGYCQARIRKIVICDMSTHPDWKNEVAGVVRAYMKETTRHEILHAFLYESGLDAASMDAKGGWARNEEMVDWFAIQGPKIMKAWKDCNAM